MNPFTSLAELSATLALCCSALLAAVRMGIL